MKIKVKLLTAMLGLSSLAFAQQQTFSLSTGVVNGSTTLISTGNNDDTWQVKTPTSGGAFLAVKVVNPLAGWWATDPSNCRWLSPASDGSSNPVATSVGEYTYQTTITIPSCMVVTSAQIVFNKIGADDNLTSVSVNGNTYALSGSFSPLSTTSVTVSGLTEGVNTIQVKLQNTQTYTGLLINGSITVNYQSVFTQPNYANGWSKEWSNNADGSIGTWGTISATDKFIPFDANGDGDEELLCVEAVNSNPPGVAAKAKILDFNGTTKTWGTTAYWTNNNNGSFDKNSFSGWGIRALDKYIVGDFDGDGWNNELLCIQGDGGYATILKFNTSTMNFDWYWSNGGNSKLNTNGTGWTIGANDKFDVGNFNFDNKNNDLFCVNNSCWMILTFNATTPKNFTPIGTGCSNVIANFNSQPVWNIGANDEFRVGDYNGDNYRNEILCTERSTGYTTSIIRFFDGGWSIEWTNVASGNTVGNGNIGGWGIPLLTTDKVLVGNLDTDSKEEFMFVQRCSNCGWSTSESLNAANNQPEWHWSNHNYSGAQENYINDWKVNDVPATNVDYLLMKPLVSGTEYLLALKKYSCSNFLASFYKPQAGINFKTNPNGTTGIDPETEQETGFNLYPNPNAGSFTVSFLSNNPRKISIYNALGAVVYETETNEETLDINLAAKDKGVYMMRVVEQNQTKVKRIIIQ